MAFYPQKWGKREGGSLKMDKQQRWIAGTVSKVTQIRWLDKFGKI